jgi:cell division protein ZapA
MEGPVRIKIFEHEYLLKSEEGEERLREIAEFVNSKFYEIRSSAGQLSDTKLAVLTAFYVASDYFQLQKEKEEFRQEIQNRARSMNRQIEAVAKISP